MSTSVSSSGCSGGYEPPLKRAVIGGDGQIVRFLLENGAKVNDQDDEGLTALYLAARAGHYELLPMLADEFGADLQLRINQREFGHSFCCRSRSRTLRGVLSCSWA